MKPHLALVDAVAGAGVLGSVFKVFPEVIGVIAATVATVYYVLLIWDRVRNKNK